MIKNNNNLDSLSKSLLADVRGVMEGKKSCSKSCKCDKCEAEMKAEVKEEAEEVNEISQELATNFFHAKQDKARKDFMRGRPTNKKGIMLAKDKIEGTAKVPATRNEEVEQIDEISHKTRSSWLSKTFKNHFNHNVDDSTTASGWRIDPPLKGPMSNSRLKIYKIASDKAQKQNMKDYEDRERKKREEYTPKVHDLRHMDHDEVYDHTQTSDEIKDGDVMRVKNGTAAMIGAWPTMIHGKSDVLHSFKPGTSIKTIDDGTYHKTSKLADATHGIKEEVEIDEAKKESPIAGTRLISKHEGQNGHHAEVRYNKDWNEYSVHHYNNGKHMGEGPVSYHGEGKEGREDATETAEHEVKNYRPKGKSLHQVKESTNEEVEVVDNEFNRTNYKHLIGKKYPKSKAPSYARVKEVTKTANEEVEIDEALVGKQKNIDKNHNGKLDKQDFEILRKGSGKWKSVSKKVDGKWTSKDVKEETIEEKLNPSMGAAAYIKDFVDSKDPRFEGKTKKERMKQALAAYYAAKGEKNESVEAEKVDTIEEGYGDKRDHKVVHIKLNGKYVASTTWAKNAEEAKKRFLQSHPEHKNAIITTTQER